MKVNFLPVKAIFCQADTMVDRMVDRMVDTIFCLVEIIFSYLKLFLQTETVTEISGNTLF